MNDRLNKALEHADMDKLSRGRPVRVFINQPSTLQPHHDIHGKVGIAIPEDGEVLDIHFCEGSIHSMRIHKSALSIKG